MILCGVSCDTLIHRRPLLWQEKQPIHKVVMTDGKRQIIQQLLQEYDIESLRTSRMPSRICSAELLRR
ncbi:hypothetical protein GCWU000342_00701 [Shuttleworthella satelles DSM 14600]|uniref:Uncharacterized protein n=1 Tax=Shuttleworthella satelles DSM 14600 TaxID=626523 RepID=C4G9P7_9FIRM|nr:hypothetical protein GCWU000342_00701 [Shuttleworthia satelles DSM 14600]